MSNLTTNPAVRNDVKEFIGGDILNLITSGMYASPLAIYREYLQNATDSIALSGNSDNGKVDITIDVNNMRVVIRDNGPGLSYAQSKRELIPVSKSGKRRRFCRGFRGIGRLSGLAFGSSVKFLTRCSEKLPITQVTWDGDKLRQGIDSRLSIETIILQCVDVEKLNDDSYPANFFEVQVEGISRHAMPYILNRDAVRSYIGEVCPVPFDIDFPYTSYVFSLFKEGTPPLTIDIHLDGERDPIRRLHKNGVYLSRGYLDQFTGFEEIRIPSPASSDYVAVGWIAHSSYLGALPKDLGVRSLRARVGNIQIGSESIFDHLFSENRFNRWCVGEIHILDPRIVPNGRRDYFEPSKHLRNLENHLGAICRKLEQRCRAESKERNRRRHFQFFIENLDATYDLATSGYLTADAARDFIVEKLSEISSARKKCEDTGRTEDFRKLKSMEQKFLNFRALRGRPSLTGVDSSDVSAYKKVFRIIVETSPSPRVAKETIETILGYNSH